MVTPVKVNLFISCDQGDARFRDALQRWLYPMRDEVNIWFDQKPEAPPSLPLPWQILLFWYSPPDQRYDHAARLQKMKERAHIFLFLTSYKALSNNDIEADITLAVNRRVEHDFIKPLVFPVLLTPSLWQKYSRLARFKPLGNAKKTLAEISPEEEGFLRLTEQLAQYIKLVQRQITEEKYYQSRLATAAGHSGHIEQPGHGGPYLGDDDEATEAPEYQQIALPEWLGWAVLFLLVLLTYRSLKPNINPYQPSRFYENSRSRPTEYKREVQPTPPPQEKPFPEDE